MNKKKIKQSSLSPEIFEGVMKKHQKTTFEPQKHSAFQLGLSIAQCLLG